MERCLAKYFDLLIRVNFVVRPSNVRPSFHPPVRPSVRPPVRQSVRRRSVRPSVHLSVHLSVFPSLRPSSFRPFRPSVHPSVRRSIAFCMTDYLSISPSPPQPVRSFIRRHSMLSSSVRPSVRLSIRRVTVRHCLMKVSQRDSVIRDARCMQLSQREREDGSSREDPNAGRFSCMNNKRPTEASVRRGGPSPSRPCVRSSHVPTRARPIAGPVLPHAPAHPVARTASPRPPVPSAPGCPLSPFVRPARARAGVQPPAK